MSECKVYRREIEEAADGRPVSTGTSSHASVCRACGDELRERERLRALVGGLGKVGAPADFDFRLRARMALAKIDRGHGRFSGTRWLYGFAPVAVAACFVVVSATLYFRQTTRPTPADASAITAPPASSVEPDRTPSVNVQSLPAAPAVAGVDIAKVNPTGAASRRTHKPAHKLSTRIMQAREVASKGERRADVELRTAVGSFTAAQIVTPISVQASAGPLRVILMDERGAEHVVPMRSVSFGSQDFLSRGATPKPAVAADVGGVW